MKLCTCFSALVSSSFRATTATTRAVQPAPCNQARGESPVSSLGLGHLGQREFPKGNGMSGALPLLEPWTGQPQGLNPPRNEW